MNAFSTGVTSSELALGKKDPASDRGALLAAFGVTQPGHLLQTTSYCDTLARVALVD
jgi:hypothetical protein